MEDGSDGEMKVLVVFDALMGCETYNYEGQTIDVSCVIDSEHIVMMIGVDCLF